MWPGALSLVVAVYYFESRPVSGIPHITWFTSIVLAGTSLAAGWILWIVARNAKGHGARLLAGLFLLMGLHGIDRPLWLQSPLFLLRIAFDHLLAVALGIAMVVLVLERARARRWVVNTAQTRSSSSATLFRPQLLDLVLVNVVGLGVSTEYVRLMEARGFCGLRAAVGGRKISLKNNAFQRAWALLSENFCRPENRRTILWQERERMTVPARDLLAGASRKRCAAGNFAVGTRAPRVGDGLTTSRKHRQPLGHIQTYVFDR